MKASFLQCFIGQLAIQTMAVMNFGDCSAGQGSATITKIRDRAFDFCLSHLPGRYEQ